MTTLKQCMLFSLCFLSFQCEAFHGKVSAKSAILMNAESGAILFEKNSTERSFPASTTKIATCAYAFTLGCDLTELVTAHRKDLRKTTLKIKQAHNFKEPAYWLEPDGTSFGIKVGETLSLNDLFHGLILVSGNDAANLVAHHLGGSIPRFMNKLNGYLKKIGCCHTHLSNPHGLHHIKHYTTAKDMALISREALRVPFLRELFKKQVFDVQDTNKRKACQILNTNRLIRPGKFYYTKAIGMKTGRTNAAGCCLVAAAEDQGRVLIAVLFNCETFADAYRDALQLFDIAFAEIPIIRPLFKGGENVFTHDIRGAKHPLQAYLKQDIEIEYFPSEEPQITTELCWNKLTPYVTQDMKVGKILIKDGNQKILKECSLLALKDLKPKLGMKVKKRSKMLFLRQHYLINLLIVICFLGILQGFISVKKKKGSG